MLVLIADDDPVYTCLLEETLQGWGYSILVVDNGITAWEAFQRPEPPSLAVIDWIMPGLNGPQVCQRVRAAKLAEQPYLILLTAKQGKSDIVTGLESGADDYLIKPFDEGELQARLKVGARILGLQRRLGERVAELEKALTEVNELRSLLPICSYCKKVRDGEQYWQQVEAYMMEHLPVQFTHGICPECYQRFFGAKVGG